MYFSLEQCCGVNNIMILNTVPTGFTEKNAGIVPRVSEKVVDGKQLHAHPYLKALTTACY